MRGVYARGTEIAVIHSMTVVPEINPMFAAVLIATLIASGPSALKVETDQHKVVDQPAAEQPLSGISVSLECVAYADGHVGNCTVLNETRPGLGFGEAAVALMNGSPVASDVSLGRAPQVKFRHTIQFTPD